MEQLCPGQQEHPGQRLLPFIRTLPDKQMRPESENYIHTRSFGQAEDVPQMSSVCQVRMETKFIVNGEGARRSILAMQKIFEDAAIILSANF